MTKITKQEIAKIIGRDIGDDPDIITINNKSVCTLRIGYYWRPKRTPEECFQLQLEQLRMSGFELSDIEFGDNFTSFKGGECIKKNSHYWVKFKITRKEVV